MTRAQSVRVALAHLAIVVALGVLLSLGGCTFEVEHTANGYRVSAGAIVLGLIVLGIVVAIAEWLERP